MLLKRIFVAAIFGLTLSKANAWPTTPNYLRLLIEDCKYIAVGDIKYSESGYTTGRTHRIITKNGKSDTIYRDYKTTEHYHIEDIYLKEVWSGTPNTMSIHDEYQSYNGWPDHSINKKVIYFGGLTSYRSKFFVDSASLPYFHKAIIEYQNILKIKEGKKKRSATIEWLITLMLNKFTLKYGAEDLSYDYPSKPEHFYKELSKNQRLRIDSVFSSDGIFLNDRLHRLEMRFVNLVSENSYPKLKEHLLNYLQKSSEIIGDQYNSADYMEAIIKISANPELIKIKDSFYKVAFPPVFALESVKERIKQEREIIAEFIAEASRK